MVTKSDFVLAPYMQSSDRRAIYQILTTVVPDIGLWILAVQAASISLWLLPPVVGLILTSPLPSWLDLDLVEGKTSVAEIFEEPDPQEMPEQADS